MSNELQAFTFEGRGIRTTIINGQLWWVAKDVCDYFGDKNRNRSLSALDDDEKGYTPIDTLGGKQKISIINESGLYHLLFIMQPTEGRNVSKEYIQERIDTIRAFKRWVTHDVLPSIRTKGYYSVERPKIQEESKKARKELTEQWKEHGADKPYHYINLTHSEYKSLGYGTGVGVHKKDMSKEEVAKLLALEAIETLKLIRNPQIHGYSNLNSSVLETGSRVDLFVDNLMAAPNQITADAK